MFGTIPAQSSPSRLRKLRAAKTKQQLWFGRYAWNTNWPAPPSGPYLWQPEPETYSDEAMFLRGVSADPDEASKKSIERAYLYRNPDPEPQFHKEFEHIGDIEAGEEYEINLLKLKDTSTTVIQLMTELNDTLCTTLYGDGISASSQLSHCASLPPLVREDQAEALADIGDGEKVKDAVPAELRHDISKCLFCIGDWARWKRRGYSDENANQAVESRF